MKMSKDKRVQFSCKFQVKTLMSTQYKILSLFSLLRILSFKRIWQESCFLRPQRKFSLLAQFFQFLSQQSFPVSKASPVIDTLFYNTAKFAITNLRMILEPLMFQAAFTVNRLLGYLTIIATSDAASELVAIVGGMDVLLIPLLQCRTHARTPSDFLSHK